ncbi:hypothetical protein [Streptomyces sp. URMC 124]|uniref:hypothetical protein n=1 Tax=Streptomyces sp. URMC 124 TaxID=3423405 RepID=UPI003F1A02A5
MTDRTPDTVRTPEDTTPAAPDSDPPTPTLTSTDTARTTTDTDPDPTPDELLHYLDKVLNDTALPAEVLALRYALRAHEARVQALTCELAEHRRTVAALQSTVTSQQRHIQILMRGAGHAR